MSSNQRKISNVKLTKQFQVKYYGWWFLVSLFLIFALSITFYMLFEEHWIDVLKVAPERNLEYLFTRSRFVSLLVFVCLMLVIGITCLGIMTAHRVAGPLLGLKKAFEEIRGGNLAYRIRFRKEDDLADLENSFNQMMDFVASKINK